MAETSKKSEPKGKARHAVAGIQWRLAIVIALALVIGLLTIRPAFATPDACRLSYAKPNELMALSDADRFGDWIPPGVACGSDDPDYAPQLCQWRTTITQDRMIGDYRLIIASSSLPGQKAMDYVFVFTCVDGRPTPTTHAQIDPDLKLDYTVYAQPHWGRGSESGRPQEFQAKSVGAAGGGGAAVFVNGQLQTTRTDSGDRPAPEVPCNQMQNVDANSLMTIPLTGWHGPGSYPATDWPEAENGWYVIVGQDKVLGDDRRLIDLRAIRKFPLRSGCSDQLYVFGCVAGQLKTVFQDRYQYLKKIDDASADKLGLVLWDLNGRRPYDPGRDQNLSWERRLTYSWNAGLQSYVLSSVRVGPPPAESNLPVRPPECVTPSQ